MLFTGTGTDPSLWLAHGTADGKLAAPADIGSIGNWVNGGGASDGPADWTGALVLHGDFTGDHVQDVMAYWPAQTTIGGATISAGHGMVLAGTGAGVTMDPVQAACDAIRATAASVFSVPGRLSGPWRLSRPCLAPRPGPSVHAGRRQT